MTFQASNLKGHHFLELCDNDNDPLEPSYAKGGIWFKFFVYLNFLCSRAIRAIINHAPIREYRLKFFPWEDFSCPCDSYPIENGCYILHEYRRHNKYWYLRRNSISHFILFLELNCRAFLFKNITT